jgi:hypothetical protein
MAKLRAADLIGHRKAADCEWRWPTFLVWTSQDAMIDSS